MNIDDNLREAARKYKALAKQAEESLDQAGSRDDNPAFKELSGLLGAIMGGKFSCTGREMNLSKILYLLAWWAL
jgi:hypothetical protein